MIAFRKLGRPMSALTSVALAVALAAPASANNRPAVAVTANVSGTNAQVAVEINRGTHQIAACTYVLDDDSATDCGTPTSAGRKAASYDIGLTGLMGGSHTVAVTIVLTDGGGDSGSASFSVTAGSRTFALAFSNRDGVAGYDPADDVLIAKLVDTVQDGVLGAGDTVITERYPVDFGPASFGSFAETTHVVANVLVATSTTVVVTDSANRQYTLQSNSSAQRYLEATAGSPARQTSIFDSLGGFDTIHAQPNSPSLPSVTVDPRISGGGPGDDSFIDVVMNMP
jgi:hypothetical protein